MSTILAYSQHDDRNGGRRQVSGSAHPFVPPPFWEALLVSLRLGMHVMLHGPRGTGKTTAVRMAAELLGRALFWLQGHCDLSIEELRGMPGLRHGNSIFQPGLVVQAVQEGGLMLFDEVNLVRPGVVAWLNNILDSGGSVAIPETGDFLPVHRNFLGCFCYNEGYQGTRQINEAFKDRCRVIFCDYWSVAQELALLQAVLPEVAEVDARRMLAVANAIREARRAGTIDFDFSIRTLKQWGQDACHRTADLMDSFKSVVLSKVGDPLLLGPQHEALLKIAELHVHRTDFSF